MVRISPEVLASAEQRINPLQERELVLSGLGIAVIENMGALLPTGGGGSGNSDAFDCYDFSNNRISSLENFASAPRVTTLLCAHNHINAWHVKNLTKNLPNVTTLSLHANAISSLAQIKVLAQGFPKLVFLDLTGNPVTRKFASAWLPDTTKWLALFLFFHWYLSLL
jgi:Leucine-rich repeat (LRR) protein